MYKGPDAGRLVMETMMCLEYGRQGQKMKLDKQA